MDKFPAEPALLPAPQRPPDEPTELWRFVSDHASARVIAGVNAPLDLAVGLEIELPWRVRLSTTIGAFPPAAARAINGRLVVTTPPAGRKIQQLYTTKEFGTDFVLRLEFRATPNADSGVYVRGPQLQCRDYGIAGPFTDLKQYKPQDWNELVVTVQNGVATATNNGEPLKVELKVPSSGPIGVEGDRGQMEYRRIRIKKL